MNATQEDPLRRQIYSRMQAEDTEELLDIWRRNDRTEWTDEAFEIVHDILLERLGSVPEQGEFPKEETQEEVEDDEDIYHHPEKLIQIASWAKVFSWVALVLPVISGALTQMLIMRTSSTGYLVLVQMSWILPNLTLALVAGGFFFLILQALAELIYIIMDIEENTRQAKEQIATDNQAAKQI
jgi:hypothetical protein